MTDPLLDAETEAQALLGAAARVEQLERELAAAHALLAEWREGVVAANRISQSFEARAIAAEGAIEHWREQARLAEFNRARLEGAVSRGEQVRRAAMDLLVGRRTLMAALTSGHPLMHLAVDGLQADVQACVAKLERALEATS